MGDVAMTVPVIQSFLSSYTKESITLVSNPRFRAFFPNNENFSFFAADTKRDYKGLVGIFKLYKDLVANGNYDLVIDLHDVLRSKILRTLFKLKGVSNYVIDKGRTEKKALTKSNNKELHQLKSSVERYRETFERAGFKFGLTFNRLSLAEQTASTQITDIVGTKNCKWIGIAPFAQHQGKIYPKEQMEKVLNIIAQKENLKILLFGGGKEESSILENWAQKSEKITSLAGKFTLSDELFIMSQCDLMLTMDSSNMHLASLVGTRVLSVWGSTHPYAGFYGYKQNPTDAIQIDLPCRPCSVYGNKPCHRSDYACLTSIAPETIANKISSILNL